MRKTDLQKNIKIKETYLATKAKRDGQSCKVITLKIQQNKLNKTQQEQLKMMFVEAKWLYNHILNLSKTQNVFDMKYTELNTITHFDKNKKEIKTQLTYLSSQMKQGVLDGVFANIRALNKAKNKGNNIGALKFISQYKSINLKQKDISYKIVSKNKIKIQGMKKPLKVNGLKQILNLENYDLANAKLLNTCDGYFIAITIYVDKTEKPKKSEKLGIDFGCDNSFSLSTGKKINYIIEESKSIKRLKRKISLSKKGSNNRYKLLNKLNKMNGRVHNQKVDFVNKLCSDLSDYQVIIQDEQLSVWQMDHHGKKIHNGVLGLVKNKLLFDSSTICLSKWIPTSKFCHRCGHSHNDLKLGDRTFICPYCGFSCDRDIHAAQNMIWFSDNIIGVGRTEYKLATFQENIEKYFQDREQEATKSLVSW